MCLSQADLSTSSRVAWRIIKSDAHGYALELHHTVFRPFGIDRRGMVAICLGALRSADCGRI